ncbi:ferredoxin [Streptomyces malaysiensis]|uniref:Ferredoxin n=1 Tax=Streptomyces malaysiensis subsp. samsunensis TaxID=459658 RepID=A0A9X2LUN7_STRMQ|nr:ferredoxin [Streptomyces samsunensis]MCQ8829912.1 ferredoxin [Streptomyces samsunensis]
MEWSPSSAVDEPPREGSPSRTLESSAMKITVNTDVCIGAAMCTGLSPQVFTLDEEGIVSLRETNPPEELRARIEQAVGFCPVAAIKIQD